MSKRMVETKTKTILRRKVPFLSLNAVSLLGDVGGGSECLLM